MSDAATLFAALRNNSGAKVWLERAGNVSSA
jgi:hypothetical protein